MEPITLTVEGREQVGEGRTLRRTGAIPAIFYGRGTASVALAVGAKEFAQQLGHAEGTQLVRLSSQVSDVDGKMVIVKEVQVHPVTSAVLHVDFYAIDLTRRLEVHVPLHFTGKPVGVTAGGILQPVHRELMLECLPTAIPSAIEVDVSELGIHDSIHVRELRLPEGVTVLIEAEEAVVTVLPPTVEAAPAEEAAEAAEGEAAEAKEGEASSKEGEEPAAGKS